MWSAILLEHIRSPRNRCSIELANIHGRSEYPQCGDVLKISLKLEDDLISQVFFEAQACAPVVGLASLASEHLIGRTLAEALSISAFEWDKLAGGVPPPKRHAILMLVDCLDQAKTVLQGASRH